MTKKDLLQLQFLKKEIQQLKNQLDDVEYICKDKYVADSVKGSSRYHPYTEHTIKIRGLDDSAFHMKITNIKEKISLRVRLLLDKTAEINEFIEGIDDSETRLILALRYVNGMTWEQIAKEINYATITVRKKHDKFMNENISQNIT